jgi:hypothetical protein
VGKTLKVGMEIDPKQISRITRGEGEGRVRHFYGSVLPFLDRRRRRKRGPASLITSFTLLGIGTATWTSLGCHFRRSVDSSADFGRTLDIMHDDRDHGLGI